MVNHFYQTVELHLHDAKLNGQSSTDLNLMECKWVVMSLGYHVTKT